VSLKKYSHEELARMSMIELADLLLVDAKKAMDFRNVFEKIAETKGFTEEQKRENIAQFYTDLNIDGRFMTTGSNMWGLKRWYPVEQIDEAITEEPKKKKKTKKTTTKKKKKEEEEEDGIDIVDEDIEEITDGFDEIDESYDEDDEESYEDDEEDEEEEESDEKEVKKKK
jgi:DNA-directed RNA polymerase subunit delta